MTDVTEAVQRAVVALLRADAALIALVGDRVHDDVPVSALSPYVSIGPIEATPLGDVDCLDARDVVIQIDCWSRAPGRVECGRVTDRVARLLNGVDLVLAAPHPICASRVVLTRIMDEGLQRHGVVQVEIYADLHDPPPDPDPPDPDPDGGGD